MGIDLQRTANLIRGSLLEETTTWPEYAAQRHPLMSTLLWITLPAVVVSAVLTFLLNLIFGGMYLFGGSGVGGLIAGVVGGGVGIAIWAGAAYFFAGLFSRKPAATSVGSEPLDTLPVTAVEPSFDQAFAAVSFGFLPGFVGSILGSLPFIGWLLMLGAFIYALMTLYRAIPVFLPVAPENRNKHFVATFLASLVASMVLSALLSSLFIGSKVRDARNGWERNIDTLESQLDAQDGQTNIPNILGVGSQVDYVQAAGADEYVPPKNGKLSAEQVARTTLFLQRTEQLRERTTKKLQQMTDDSNSDAETPSLGDLFKGIRGAMTVGTAEMQVVKAAGGNWAEHEWIKQALYQAQIHQDLNDVTKHNYKLYLQHEEILNELL